MSLKSYLLSGAIVFILVGTAVAMSREECEYNKTMMIAIAKDRDAGMTEKQEVHQIVTQFTNAGFKQGLPGPEIVKTIDFWKGMTHMVYILIPK